MCGSQAGESLLKRGGNARTWEPLANPPSARHGTFAEQGPPTLKACSREQTQQRDLPCAGLTILGDKCTARCRVAGGRGRHLRPWDTERARCEAEAYQSLCNMQVTPVHRHVCPVHDRDPCSPGSSVHGQGCRDQFCAVSVLLKCPARPGGGYWRCDQQGALTGRNTWDNPGEQKSNWSDQNLFKGYSSFFFYTCKY